MTTWQEYVQKGVPVPEWPYPIRYGEENEITTDVLILGGGIAGCHAAINAARNGARVAVIEKGMTKRSGSGGAGVDHWHYACTNPCSKVTPDEFIKVVVDSTHGYTSGPARYIDANESWDTLLDCEGMGMGIRDVDDEFKGAIYRDEATRLMFAYDYEYRASLRVWGHNVKPCLYRELTRLGVAIYDRVLVTSLLTEGGRPGARVVGATGINARTGEFYVFRSRATVVATGGIGRLWIFAPELIGPSTMNDFNASGAGQAIGWQAGAEFVLMEQSSVSMGYSSYAMFSMGNASNTWEGSPIVDANGKEVPWFDGEGRPLKTWRERFQPVPGQKFTLRPGTHLAPDLPERIRQGEYTLPLYADLTRLPETERRVIFGMMVGNEGKTRIPVYDIYTKAGFDPDKDMLQAPVLPPETYNTPIYWLGMLNPNLRRVSDPGPGCGFLVDWDLRTSLEGLYAAGGGCISGAGDHASAATSGRYSGRKAASYARTAPEPDIDHHQLAAEKARVYAPLRQNQGSIGWKELNAGIARVMQDYCGQYRSEETLRLGLRLLRELREAEAARACAANPHELCRTLECFQVITFGEMVMHASLARKASSAFLDFHRLDYPQLDPPEWAKLLPIRLEGDEIRVRELPLDYHLRPPYAPTYRENYELHRNVSTGK
jgi:succinate dehydrogenase/fumarate reductase flavoprotein subunit